LDVHASYLPPDIAHILTTTTPHLEHLYLVTARFHDHHDTFDISTLSLPRLHTLGIGRSNLSTQITFDVPNLKKLIFMGSYDRQEGGNMEEAFLLQLPSTISYLDITGCWIESVGHILNQFPDLVVAGFPVTALESWSELITPHPSICRIVLDLNSERDRDPQFALGSLVDRRLFPSLTHIALCNYNFSTKYLEKIAKYEWLLESRYDVTLELWEQ
jgi:hypothetical protein